MDASLLMILIILGVAALAVTVRVRQRRLLLRHVQRTLESGRLYIGRISGHRPCAGIGQLPMVEFEYEGTQRTAFLLQRVKGFIKDVRPAMDEQVEFYYLPGGRLMHYAVPPGFTPDFFNTY